MSGIAGIYSVDGCPVDLNILERMTDLMSARGPDGAGRWNGVGVALGHRMLRATPESREQAQPLRDEAGGFCLSFDGRLDNRDELVAMLGAEGLRDQTDPELVLRAYQKWGEQCPEKFLGDFAFAISDQRKQQIFCARDQLGLRPFYYHANGSRVIFASDIQALFEDRTVVRQPNLIALGAHLMDLATASRDTLYQGVYRLPAGHSMVVNRQGPKISRYWDIDPASEIRYRKDADYSEHFLDLFQRAVRCRLRTTGPAAALLSGGVDSGAVVCTAQQLLREGLCDAVALETFSITFEGFPAADERDFIAKVVVGPNTTANFLSFQKDSSWFDLDRANRFPDVLYDVANLIYAPALCAIQQRGIKVLLTGFGGDELLANGFEHLWDLFSHGDLAKLVSALRHDAAVYGKSPFFLFANFCLKPLVPARSKAALATLVRPFRREFGRPGLNPKILKGLRQDDSLRTTIPHFSSSAQQAIYYTLFLGPQATTQSDALGQFYARFGLELRCPFLDRRLVEFVFAIPEEQRWRHGQSKFVLREAMKNILPEEIRTRRGKADISGPIDVLLRHRRAEIDRLFHNSVLVSLGLLDGEWLERRLKRSRGERYPYEVQDVLALELWCRISTDFN